MHFPFLSEDKKQRYVAHLAERAKAWPVPCEERTVETSRGRTFMRISGPADAPPLVLLPGGATSSLMWRPVIAGLASRYRVYALDSILDVGLSANSGPVKTVDDLVEWLDELFRALGFGPDLRLMGMSHGGWLAANFALRRPERVGKVVLVAPAAFVLDMKLSIVFQMISILFPPRRFWIRRTYRASLPGLARTAAGPAIIDDMTEDLALAFECFGVRRLTQMVPPLKASDEELRGLRVPTLYVVGEDETIYDPKAALARLEQVAPQVQRALVPGAGHDLPWSKPAELGALALEFLG
ncbi:MAG: alpha/beta hydrolase [Polyangiaceae bacterium]|nr:alpha/beta hydrolase [Polyangiaceae bacterium]